MDGEFVRQRDNPKYSPTKLGNGSPESISSVRLEFYSDWIFYYPDTPQSVDIRTFPKDFVL
ncbi:MAG: hypothetical protein ABI142_09835 [Bryocella sp.]